MQKKKNKREKRKKEKKITKKKKFFFFPITRNFSTAIVTQKLGIGVAIMRTLL